MERLNQTGAGNLQQLVAFDARGVVDDGMGNVVSGPWAEEFQAYAQFFFGRGSEEIMAARLEGREPMIVRIRMCADARRITTDWRMRDVRADDKAFNIRDITYDNNRAVVDLAVEGGVAV